MECQVEKNMHFRHILLFAFNRGFTAAKAAREIRVVYGKNAMSERTARYWFAKFREENFDLKDAPRSGRPTQFDEGQLNKLLHEDSRQSTRELAERMNCSHTCIEKHLNAGKKVDDKIELLHEDPRQSTRELAERMNCSHTCIEKHLNAGKFEVEDKNELLHEDPRQSTRELVEGMNCSHTCIEKYLNAGKKVEDQNEERSVID